MISNYLIDIIILLIAAVAIVPLFQILKVGAVPGFLVSGVLVGPYGLGLISNIEEIYQFAEIGVVLLLFIIGIELKPSRLWLMRRLVFGLGTLQILFTGVVLGFVFDLIFDIGLNASILVGPALALSSTAFVLQLLGEQKLFKSEYGRTSISVLLMQDIAVVPLLALIPLLTITELSIGADIGFALVESFLILVVIIFVGRYLLHPVVHRVALSGSPEVFTASAVLLVLGMAAITEYAGFSMAMGAFLAGLLISDSSYRHHIVAELQPFRGFLLGLFFMSMGMYLNTDQLFDGALIIFGSLFLLILIKILILVLLTKLFRINSAARYATSLILAQSGEFALVLFSLAHESQIITEQAFQRLLTVVLLSMLVTPLLAFFAKNINNKKSAKALKNDNSETNNVPIVIVGFGRVGARIGQILSIAKIPFVAVDCDAKIVEEQRKKGCSIYFGDVLKPNFLDAIGVESAKTTLITMNDPEASIKVVSLLNKNHPELNVYARGHNLEQCIELKKKGASGVVSENIEASIELSQMAVRTVGFDSKKIDNILKKYRDEYYSEINKKV